MLEAVFCCSTVMILLTGRKDLFLVRQIIMISPPCIEYIVSRDAFEGIGGTASSIWNRL